MFLASDPGDEVDDDGRARVDDDDATHNRGQELLVGSRALGLTRGGCHQVVSMSGVRMSLGDIMDTPLSWTISLVPPLLWALPRGPTR